MPLFSFTLSFHGLQSSPPSFNTKVDCFFQGPQITGQFWWTGMQRSSKDSSCVTIVPLQNLIVYIFKVKNVVSANNRILIDWILTLSLETVFTKSTNKQSLEMTAPAPCKPLLVCGTGMYLGSFAHPLYWELKHLFSRCDSRTNSTHSARSKVCKLRVQTHFPSQN